MDYKKITLIFGIMFFIAIVILGVAIIKPLVFVHKTISINGDNVILSRNAYRQLNEIYPEGLEFEIASCLMGNGLKVDEVVRAEVVESTPTNCTYIRCPTYIEEHKVIGTIHNHPSGICKLSDTDLVTYAYDMERGQTIIGLKCARGYIFYILTLLEGDVEKW